MIEKVNLDDYDLSDLDDDEQADFKRKARGFNAVAGAVNIGGALLESITGLPFGFLSDDDDEDDEDDDDDD